MNSTPWRKSSRSGGQGNCVEFRELDGSCQLRDSKDPNGGEVTVSPAAFKAFIDAVKGNAFDLR